MSEPATKSSAPALSAAASPVLHEYEARRGHFAGARQRDEARAAQVGWARLGAFALMVACVVAIVWGSAPSALWGGFAACLVGFVALLMWHARIYQRVSDARRGETLYEHGLLRVQGRFREVPCELPPAPADHPYADDLDVLGRGSLLHRLDRTRTAAARERLSGWLLAAAEPLREGELEALRLRHVAVQELAGAARVRERLATELAPELQPEKLLTALREAPALPAPWLLRGFGVALPLATALAFWGWPRLWWVPVLCSFALSMWVSARLAGLFALGRLLPDLLRAGVLMQAIGAESFEAPGLRALASRTQQAAAVLSRLTRVSSFVSARENEVFRLVIGPMLAWDVHCALSLASVAQLGQDALADGFEALSELEALSSLAWFAHEEPGAITPQLEASAGGVRFSRLAHPLLAPGVRVANDVTVEGRGKLLLVTGSNMAGKSTLLRAVGLAVVLARAGAPVVADAAALGQLHLAVSLRMRDDVGEGVSRFYAELRKLKVVLEAARRPAPDSAAFFLVDELLSGTNSRERAIGARALLLALLELGAHGIASTHDLELHSLAEREHVAIGHFAEQVQGDKLAFDYTLREGPVRSSNALRLMHEIGLDVVPLPPAEPAQA